MLMFAGLHNVLCCTLSQALVAYESLLPTLARVLREDGKRSLELATNLVSAFYCCSALRQLHALISDNQV